MLSNPFMTVVTVAYNAGNTIADTMQSVAAQTYDRYEHLVLDGGSTDNTMAIVHRSKTARTRVICERDNGIYDAMNKGLLAASGSVVCFLNADDLYHANDVLARVATRFESEHADVVYGDIDYFRTLDTGRVTRRWRSGAYSTLRVRLGWHPPHPAFFARKHLLQSVGSFATDLTIAADYELMVKALSVFGVRVCYVPSVLVRMREGGASTSGVLSHLKGGWQSYRALRRSGLPYPALTVALKPLRKLVQFAPQLGGPTD